MRASFICRLWLFAVSLSGALYVFTPGNAHAQTSGGGMVAASFNCAHAPGVDEQLICSDPLVRQADHDLGQAYTAARDANPEATYRASLRNDEHSWILQRNAECGVTRYTVVTRDNRPGIIDCLLDEYAERIDDLRQMRAQPQTSPAAISHPIRKIPQSAPAAPAALSATFSSLQLPASAALPLLAWRDDGTLLLLTQAADGSFILAGETGGALHDVARLAGAVAFNRMCSLPDEGILLLPGSGDAAIMIAADGQQTPLRLPELPEEVQQACGIGATGLTVAGGGRIIHYGPARLGEAPSPRFVTMSIEGGRANMPLPIRIDSRFHLDAAYMPFADAFLLNQAVDPASLEPAVERHWAKSNCFAYWQVAAKTGAVTPGCIPFGPYVNEVPVALPTRGGTYLAAGSFGLFELTAGGAQLVMQGDVSQASVSPDGCSLGFFLAQGQQAAGALIVLNACKNLPTNAATGTPSASLPAPLKN